MDQEPPEDKEQQDVEALQARLAALESEHRDLDDVIARLTESSVVDQLQLRRLKKRKLQLKDQITRLHALILPNIIA
jgi:hypothetical protein